MTDNIFRATSPVETCCRDCKFASYEENYQTGCTAGRLELLGSRPGVVIETCQDPPEIEQPKLFRVIDGATCLYKRPLEWTGDTETARQEIRDGIKVRLIVVANGPEPEATFRTLDQTGYWKIGVVPGTNPPPRSTFGGWFRENAQCPWAVDWYYGGEKATGDIIDDSLRNCPSTFYVLAQAGAVLPPDLPAKIVAAVVDREKAFLALEGEGYLVVQTSAHNHIGGNTPSEIVDGSGRADTVLEKLQHVATQQQQQFVFGVDYLDG